MRIILLVLLILFLASCDKFGESLQKKSGLQRSLTLGDSRCATAADRVTLDRILMKEMEE